MMRFLRPLTASQAFRGGGIISPRKIGPSASQDSLRYGCRQCLRRHQARRLERMGMVLLMTTTSVRRNRKGRFRLALEVAKRYSAAPRFCVLMGLIDRKSTRLN